jgi:uncharacterized coiled-coil protein SlyX
MSLTKQDLADIRTVVYDAINDSFEALSAPRFDALEERIDGLESRMSAQESAQQETNRRLTSIETKLEAIESDIETLKNDVKALYELTGKPLLPSFDKEFEKLSKEDKVRTLHAYTLKLAKQLNIHL